MKTLALLAAMAIMGSSAWAQEQVKPEDQANAREVQETKEQRDARMAWWREARFGMFIHWGLYAVPAGQWNGKPVGGIGEWIMNNAKIPVTDYAKFAEQFNPVKFDADAWVRVAREAGMKTSSSRPSTTMGLRCSRPRPVPTTSTMRRRSDAIR